MKKLMTLMAMWALAMTTFAQVNYTANDQVTPYNGDFRPGTNLGFFPDWTSQQLVDLAAGNAALGVQGIGAQTCRPVLSEKVLEIFGYDIALPLFEHMEDLGMDEITATLAFPAEWHQDQTQYCPGVPSQLFANLYEPIWDGGLNGTPYNDENYFAAYVYKTLSMYHPYVRFWEIWNEPGFDETGNTGWRPPGYQPGNWWDRDPLPCEYKLKAPIEHFVRTLRIAYEVIKTVAPDDYVVVAGFGFDSFADAVCRNTDNPIDGSPTAEYPLGGGAYFDVMGFHSYPHFDGSTTNYDQNFFERHSDAAADGLVGRREYFQNILDDYGYDGNTYPRKETIITEINVPREWEGDDEFFSSTLGQRNFIIKAFIKAKLNRIHQIHVFGLSDNPGPGFGFNVMGLYQNLRLTPPFSQIMNPEGVAYKTVSDLIFDTDYDAGRTSAMQVPTGMRGHAFKRSDGKYIYAIWAETMTDLSETAFINYSFPSAMNVGSLTRYNWGYAQSNQSSSIAPTGIQLDAQPVFLLEGTTNPGGPIAAFATEISSGCAPLTIQFLDQSSGNPTNYNWTFPGGNPSSSTATNPVVTYNTPGNYTVSLEVSNTFGSDTETKSGFISILDAPSANFSISTNSLTVSLTNLSQDATSYSWDFGDGNTSTVMNPTHTYAAAGSYVIQLLTSNACGSATFGAEVNVNGNPGNTIDLELNLAVDDLTYDIYETVTYTLTVNNKGQNAATGVTIDFPLPDGLVFTSQTVSQGNYSNWDGIWNVGDLAAGANAQLNLTLFTLVEGVNIVNFAQVKTVNQSDSDSTPDNNNGLVPQEDDEAAITIVPDGSLPPTCTLSGAGISVVCSDNNTSDPADDVYAVWTNPTGSELGTTYAVSGDIFNDNIAYGAAQNIASFIPISDGIKTINLVDDSGNCELTNIVINPPVPCSEDPGPGMDLELQLSVDQNQYSIYENVLYTLKVSNTGSEIATDIVIDFPMPDGLVYTSQNQSAGAYSNWTGKWLLDNLAAGANATLELSLFTLVSNEQILNYAEVLSAAPNDVDSSPGNGNGNTAIEDDEAAVTINPLNAAADARILNDLQHPLLVQNIFPNPVMDDLVLVIHSLKKQSREIIISDATGREQLRKNHFLAKGKNEVKLEIGQLPAGMYFVLLPDARRRGGVVKFVKVLD